MPASMDGTLPAAATSSRGSSPAASSVASSTAEVGGHPLLAAALHASGSGASISAGAITGEEVPLQGASRLSLQRGASVDAGGWQPHMDTHMPSFLFPGHTLGDAAAPPAMDTSLVGVSSGLVTAPAVSGALWVPPSLDAVSTSLAPTAASVSPYLAVPPAMGAGMSPSGDMLLAVYMSLLAERRFTDITHQLDLCARAGDQAALMALTLIAQGVDVALALGYTNIVPPAVLAHAAATMVATPPVGAVAHHLSPAMAYGGAPVGRSPGMPTGAPPPAASYYGAPAGAMAYRSGGGGGGGVGGGAGGGMLGLPVGLSAPASLPTSSPMMSDGFFGTGHLFPPHPPPASMAPYSVPQAMATASGMGEVGAHEDGIMTSLGLPLYLGASPPRAAGGGAATRHPELGGMDGLAGVIGVAEYGSREAPLTPPPSLFRGGHVRHHSGGDTILIPAGEESHSRLLFSPDSTGSLAAFGGVGGMGLGGAPADTR